MTASGNNPKTYNYYYYYYSPNDADLLDALKGLREEREEIPPATDDVLYSPTQLNTLLLEDLGIEATGP